MSGNLLVITHHQATMSNGDQSSSASHCATPSIQAPGNIRDLRGSSSLVPGTKPSSLPQPSAPPSSQPDAASQTRTLLDLNSQPQESKASQELGNQQDSEQSENASNASESLRNETALPTKMSPSGNKAFDEHVVVRSIRQQRLQQQEEQAQLEQIRAEARYSYAHNRYISGLIDRAERLAAEQARCSSRR